MATSQELIAALRERGVNNARIAEALGIDRSTISQVSRGVKPGRNLAGSLSELRDRLAQVENPAAAARGAAVTPPPKRTTASGRPARVRQKMTHTAGASTTSTVKRQGAQHGARGAGKPLAAAIERGHRVAVTVQFSRAVTVSLQGYVAGKRGAKSTEGPGGRLVAALDDEQLETVAAELATGATPAAAIAEALGDSFYATGGGRLSAADAVAAMQSIELRTWEP